LHINSEELFKKSSTTVAAKVNSFILCAERVVNNISTGDNEKSSENSGGAKTHKRVVRALFSPSRAKTTCVSPFSSNKYSSTGAEVRADDIITTAPSV